MTSSCMMRCIRLLNATGDSTGPADRPLFDLHNLFSDQKHAFTEGTLVLDAVQDRARDRQRRHG